MKRASSLRLRRPKPMGRSWPGAGRFCSVTAMVSGHLLPGAGVGFVLGSPADRGDDVLVARAAADLAADGGADLRLAGVRIVVQKRPAGHQHSRGAEPAVQGVLLVKAL